ncbi:acyltransferase [Maricaulis sp.]|uniref:acyltransferase family protein n=1 Tax=Maricaulis sp. TaxID=1486257 RepID=UPI0025C34644|nr:acyltransferase [Maricaulis sp.]
MPIPRPHAEIIELQYLRAIAVLMVVGGHLHQAGARFVGADLVGQAGFVGFAGVDVFFVISGFIIHTLYRQAKGPSLSFALKRLNRIFPLYWIFTAVTFAGYLVISEQMGSADRSIEWLTTLTLLPTGHPPLLMVGWTLTHELYFYLVYGLALFLPRRWRIGAAALWATLTLLSVGDVIHPDQPWAVLALSGFNLQFLAGVILAEFRDRLPRLRGASSAVALLGLALAIGWTSISGIDGLSHADTRAIIFAPMAIGVVWAVLAWQPRWPRALAAIGDWSYAIYLGHLLVIGVLARLLPGLIPGTLPALLVLYATGLGASILLGALTHRLVEQPLLVAGKALIARVSPRQKPDR